MTVKLMAAATDLGVLFGKISPPPGTPVGAANDPASGLVQIMRVGLNLLLIVAGLYTLLNLILAGYSYVTSSGDPKKISEANSRITYTVVGLVIIAVPPLVAAVIGIAVFGHWDAIINPSFTTIQDQLTPTP